MGGYYERAWFVQGANCHYHYSGALGTSQIGERLPDESIDIFTHCAELQRILIMPGKPPH